MKRLLLLALVLTAGTAHAQVDPKTHEKCIKANDYAGCVSANESNLAPVSIWASRLNMEDRNVLKRYSKQKGVKIRLIQARGDVLVERLKKTQDPSADVLILVEPESIFNATNLGLFQTYSSKNLDREVPEDRRDPLDRWYGLTESSHTRLTAAGISKYTTNKSGAADLLEFLASPQGYQSEAIATKDIINERRKNNSKGCPPGKSIYQKTAFFGLIKGAKLCLTDYEAEQLKQARITQLQNTLSNMETQRRLDQIEQNSRMLPVPRMINCTSNSFGSYMSVTCY